MSCGRATAPRHRASSGSRAGRSSTPTDLTDVSGRLFFRASTSGTPGLWTSDGSAAGTMQLITIDPGTLGGSPTFDLAALSGALFLTNFDTEIWRSDGTVAGTTRVATVPGVLYCTFAGCFLLPSYPGQLTEVNGTLFFTAAGGGDEELWKSDGTEAGTVQVTDIYPGYSASPAALTNLNGVLLFAATDFDGGRELWRSDGTLAGTARVADINPGIGDSDPAHLTDVGGTVFFTAFDPTHGRELWQTNGSAPGTGLVADIAPGAVGSDPSDLTNVSGELFFSASDPTTGRELWMSDGTTTARLADIAPGPASSQPNGLVDANGVLFLAAADPSIGSELWAVEVVCRPRGNCGNGILDSGEACDEGVANGMGSCCACDCTTREADAVCRPSTGACDAPRFATERPPPAHPTRPRPTATATEPATCSIPAQTSARPRWTHRSSCSAISVLRRATARSPSAAAPTCRRHRRLIRPRRGCASC